MCGEFVLIWCGCGRLFLYVCSLMLFGLMISLLLLSCVVCGMCVWLYRISDVVVLFVCCVILLGVVVW